MPKPKSPGLASSLEVEQSQFAQDVLLSIQQHGRRDHAAVHSPEQIMARRRGRPPGSTQAVTKEPVKIRLDADLLEALRASGEGWQTRINSTLRASMALSGRLT